MTLLAKDCATELRACLASLKATFLRDVDEVIVLDTSGSDGGETTRAAKEFGARVLDGRDLRLSYREYVERWLPEFLPTFEKSSLTVGALLNFGAARQRVMDAASHDIQFWIDADDVLVESAPGQLRNAIEDLFGENKADSIFLDYVYGHDPDDNAVCSILKRERVVSRKHYHWVGHCHETAIPRPGAASLRGAYLNGAQAAIEHRKAPTDAGQINSSDLRNYVILRKELEDDLAAGRVPDPRTEFYLGNAARGLGRDVEAIKRYTEFIGKSGSRDDRYCAAYFIATIYLGPKTLRPLDALTWLERCLRLKPEDPRGYFAIARAYLILGRWNEAIHWNNVGMTLPEPSHSLHNYDPRHIRVLPLQVAAAAAKELGDEAAATRAVDGLMKVAPNHSDTKKYADIIGNWLAGRKLVAAVRSIVANARPIDLNGVRDAGRAVTALLPDVPEELAELGLLPTEPPDTRPVGRGDVSIYCGRAIEPWGPKSGEHGIGGSEKAVVQMAKRLQARGLRVTVYAGVPRPQRGFTDGVLWQHYGAFDYRRVRDTVIFWRSPELLELQAPIQRRILWCHDVQDAGRWTPERILLADEVWVLSEAHAKTLGKARELLGDKVWITRNGVDADLFRKLSGTPRDPKKVVYCSSPDRGLLTSIKAFQKADIEGSTLHIFYGFGKLWFDWAAKNEYMAVCDVGKDVNMYEFQQEILNLVDNDERIKWHGRVGWDEIAKELSSAGVWVYPTRFYEISCMAAMEAQAAGCIPVCTDYAALAETVFTKTYVGSIETTAERLRLAVEEHAAFDRATQHKEACRRFDYEALAEEWTARLATNNATAATALSSTA